MEGVNPLLFTAHDRGAAGDGLSGRIVAVLIVADYAAEESYIDGGNPVVVVDIDSGECGDKDFVGCLAGDIRQQRGIECMQSFEDDDTVFVESEPLALKDTLAFLERLGG